LRGPVVGVNLKRGFVAVRTDGGLTIVELLGGYDVQLGDTIAGNLESLGGESLYNETRMEAMDVSIQNFHCSDEAARQFLV
jgi:hypothetical protein